MANDDLVAVWEEHLASEFGERNPDGPTLTMVADAYVNHVATMTGGTGIDELKRFYKYHFVTVNPPDMQIVPLSRTIGANTIVDEMVVEFTHTCVIDYLLPGIAPTGRRVKIPAVVIAQFRDGKLRSEHIYWDQASVLVQIGELDPTGLPIAGVEVAQKVLDPTRPSNELMTRESQAPSTSPRPDDGEVEGHLASRLGQHGLAAATRNPSTLVHHHEDHNR